jgi:S-formylglutathione hydrolase FrmB
MNRLRWLAAALVLSCLFAGLCHGRPLRRQQFHRLQTHLHGQLLDFTRNHGADRRIWSSALCEKRDLYVYLPPCFDPDKNYPLMIFLHGFGQDEAFFERTMVELLDSAMATDDLPAMIIAAPDGSIRGRQSYCRSFSFFANTPAGDFEDFLLIDVWDFLTENFPIRCEAEAHVVTGTSLGGGAAYRLAIEHQDLFKHVIGVFPALNLRWIDCHGRYRGNFHPDCWDWRERARPFEVVGRYYGFPVRSRVFTSALKVRGQEAIEQASASNPIELLDVYDVQDGDLGMFVGYARRDQFNIDAQVESFLYRARERGITVEVAYDPRGRHDVRTGVRLLPYAVDWLAPRIRPYSP